MLYTSVFVAIPSPNRRIGMKTVASDQDGERAVRGLVLVYGEVPKKVLKPGVGTQAIERQVRV